MNRINVLDESVASRIAAGEVVVNPAAVVKELVENSLDAGATAVTVEIAGGGRELIRVTDNGWGIHEEDVPLAVMKHATSKIAVVNDLSDIATLGFRGEALASMAAVSRLTVSTRTKESISGVVLRVNGGGDAEITAAGLPEGTTVRVENLFYNVPARQKFLKNAAQESAKVGDVVSKMIPANPAVSVKYVSNGKTVYQSPGTGRTLDALMTVYGADIADKAEPLEYDYAHVKISGYISKPSTLYKTGSHITFYLNGRYIQSVALRGALMKGYGERILRSHFPFAALYIKMRRDAADVNVHPGKLQVMFYDEQGVCDAVSRAVGMALQKNEPPRVRPQSRVGQAPAKTPQAFPTEPAQKTETRFLRLNPADRLYRSSYGVRESASSVMGYRDDGRFSGTMDALVKQTEKEESAQTELEDVRGISDYRLIGQAFDTYLICESGGVLYLIDQHAAHERVSFERMKAAAEKGGGAAQRLLVPVVKRFSQKNYQIIENNMELLERIGFEIEEFGALTFRFSALPAVVGRTGADSLIDEMLFELKNGTEDMLLARDRVIRAACRYSVKAGQRLSGEEIAGLLSEITKMKAIPTCPHGRPIATALTREDLQKGFKRTL